MEPKMEEECTSTQPQKLSIVESGKMAKKMAKDF